MNNYLCINEDKCCILTTELKFNELKEFINKYKHTNLPGKFRSTNWLGNDDVDRTLKLNNWELTDKIITYDGVYRGCDYDHGHSYNFEFKFNKIVKIKKSKYHEL